MEPTAEELEYRRRQRMDCSLASLKAFNVHKELKPLIIDCEMVIARHKWLEQMCGLESSVRHITEAEDDLRCAIDRLRAQLDSLSSG